MNEEGIVFLAVAVPLMTLGGGVLIILMAMYQRTKTLEMKHQERMAMIERGLAPGPATDPEAFELSQRPPRPTSRATSIGVIWVALGFGLMLLIGFAADSPAAAVGVGGAIVFLGIAFIINGELHRRSHTIDRLPYGRPPMPPHSYGRTDPPGPVGP